MPFNSYKEDEVLKESLNFHVFKRLFSYLKPYKLQVFEILLLMTAVIAVELLNPYFLKICIDKYIKNGDKSGLIPLGIVAIVINIISLFCTKAKIIKMSEISNKILLTIRQELYTHMQKLSFSFFDNRPVGKILARIIGDVNSLNDLFSNSVTSLIPDIVKLLAAAVIMLAMNYNLAIGALITLPFLMITLGTIKTVSQKRWQIYKKKTSNINAFTYEGLSGIRVVQNFTAESDTNKTFLQLLTEQKDAFMKAIRMNDAFWPTVEMSWGIGTVVVFWLGMRLIDTGTITVGLLVAFTGYISLFWQPIMNISNFYNQLITNISGAERIFEIMDIAPEITDNPSAIIMPSIKGDLEFKNVTFGYDQKIQVIMDLSFKIKGGETVALVGHTGSGKTSIVNLISRFYDVQSGEILIDGHNVKNVTVESLRAQMGIMLQDTFLFSGTIKENIRYGNLNASDDDVIRAAKAVCAHEFITKLENGYDTRVNERGSRLSTGQRQLIAFARALLANPRILILDEATASIDTHTERLVQQGIKSLLKNRTSIVIAHRLSTIQEADRIMVIDKGIIIESGTHETLMKHNGLYKQLFMSQFKFLEERVV